MLKTSTDQRKPLPNFEHLFTTTAQAPNGVARLRELILTLAVQGKLVAQDPSDEPAYELLKKIRAEKERLIAEGKIKKDKPLPEITDEEKPFDLPVGWEWVQMDAISEFTNGFAFPSSQFSSDVTGVGIVKIGDIQDGEVKTSCMSFVSRDYAKNIDTAFYVNPGDMLIAMSGATTGKIGFNLTDSHFLLNQRVGKIRFYLIDKKYAYSYLQTKVSENLAISAGSAIPNLSTAQIKEIIFPLPPLAEQSRIVTRVEELMRLCDALEEKGRLEHTQHQQLLQAMLDSLTQTTDAAELARHWQRLAQHFDLLIDRPEAVDALEQTILQLAVRGLLVPQDPSDEPASELLKKIRAEKDRLIAEGKIKKDKPLPAIGEDEKPFELPVGWEWVRLGCLIELISGQHLGPSEYIDGLAEEIPYLTGPAEFGLISPEPSRSTKERRAIAICNDILITVKGSGVGKLNVVSQNEIAISRQLMAIRPVATNADFLMLFLQTMALYFQSKSVGIAIPGIGREDVSHALLGLPPLAEQSRIVARVTELRALCQQLRDKLTQARHTQTQLAQVWVEQVAA